MPFAFHPVPTFHFQAIHFPSRQVGLDQILFLALQDREMLSLLCPCQIGLVEIAYLPPCDKRVLTLPSCQVSPLGAEILTAARYLAQQVKWEQDSHLSCYDYSYRSAYEQ